MLVDGDIDGLEEELDSFNVKNAEHTSALQILTKNYGKLIEDYRRLKSECEEVRDARDKYKRLAKDQDRNPFVLMLIDGDGYAFKDQLIRAGGVDTAQLLQDQIKEYLPRLGRDAERCRVMVRIYANLQGLSKACARVSLAGNEARSLAPFTASFTRAQELFDFVDAGDKKEGADFKIRELFRLFIDNSQCKHIFFAGCHDNGYLSMLTPHQNKTDRITLIRGPGFSSEFGTLGLKVEEFPSVFRTTPLEGNSRFATVPASPSSHAKPQIATQSYSENKALARTKQPCTFFSKGIHCRYGDKCHYAHISTNGRGIGGPDVRDVHGTNGTTSSKAKEYAPTNGPSTPNEDIVLPQPKDGLIPLNKEGHRIDTFLPKGSQEDWVSFRKRIQYRKVCNDFQLAGKCSSDDCQYDHDSLPEELVNVLRHVAREIQCQRKGACRNGKCYKAHVCAKKGCKSCKLGYRLHGVDMDVAEWVEPEIGRGLERAESATTDEIDGVSLTGRKSSSPLSSFGDGSTSD